MVVGHELGHFLTAKWTGMKATEFFVGFGPRIWSFRRGETEYGIKAIPMGGYIRRIGMFPPRAIKDVRSGRFQGMIEQAREDSLQEIGEGEHSRTFYSLSVPKKLTVMFGGPFMNLVLAFVFFALSISAIGSMQPSTQVRAVVQCIPTSSNVEGLPSTNGQCVGSAQSAAFAIGLVPNDILTSVNGKLIQTWDDLGIALVGTAGKFVEVNFLHDGQSISKSVMMTSRQNASNPIGSHQGFLGVSPVLEMQRQPIGDVPGVVWEQTRSAVSALASFPTAVVYLGQNLFSDQPRDPAGPVGVIGVGRITGEISSDSDFSIGAKAGTLLALLASLNLFLFLFNLLPILPLDGGHMAGAIFEGIRRTVARIRGVDPLPGPSDTARMLPLTYVVALLMIGTSVLVALADIIKPITLG
jgi:membrane-associated protease RseP (regulator of RpoE activity)